MWGLPNCLPPLFVGGYLPVVIRFPRFRYGKGVYLSLSAVQDSLNYSILGLGNILRLTP